MADAPLPTFTTLRLTRLGDYALEVALNRPRKSNAIDSAMWRELRACFDSFDKDGSGSLCAPAPPLPATLILAARIK